jgi:RNA polymerase sporulation-specific sigma factor
MIKQERDQFIEDNLPLVNKIACKYVKANTMREFEDLFQIGCIGLIKAADKFDNTLGFKFSTYAYRLIEGEIINNVNRKEEKTVDTIGIEEYVNGCEGQTIEDTLKDESIGEYEFIEDDAFRMLLKGLSEKQSLVIKLRFDDGLAQLEVSEILGVTKQRISELEKIAINKLRMVI